VLAADAVTPRSATTHVGAARSEQAPTRGDVTVHRAATVEGAAVRTRPESTHTAPARAATLQSRSAVRSRSATVPAHASPPQARTAVAQPARGQINVARSGAMLRAGPTTARSGVPPNMSRSAMAPNVSRSATSPNVSRSGTAVFSDLSRMGGGYAACRDAYNTCMDQFCANANEVFRRCFCSERFRDLQHTDEVLTRALGMLQDFADRDLRVVGLTAREVEVEMTMSEGERAAAGLSGVEISAALSGIRDLLAGREPSGGGFGGGAGRSSPASFTGTLSLGLLDTSDIWAGGGSGGGTGFGGMWSTGGGANIAEMDGRNLYNEVNRQCSQMVRSQCESDSVLQMVRSAYSLVIAQDCNAVERRTAERRLTLENRVREAERVLRDARLDDFRARNSASVNECIVRVRAEIMHDGACGTNWRRCLDFSGRYIERVPAPGEPRVVYSPVLFQLAEQLDLATPPSQNDRAFREHLQGLRVNARGALGMCEDDSNLVWERFLDEALIEIAQAQSRMLQEIRGTCVSIMARCYDNQSGQLGDFDTTRRQTSAALGAQATRAMCAREVGACASLHCPPTARRSDGSVGCDECQWNETGRITNADRCGLSALINFVAAVDTVHIGEGCEEALTNHLNAYCAPSRIGAAATTGGGTTGGPSLDGCFVREPRAVWDELNRVATGTGGAVALCPIDDVTFTGTARTNLVGDTFDAFHRRISQLLATECRRHGGFWDTGDSVIPGNPNLSGAFYGAVMGNHTPVSPAEGDQRRTGLQAARTSVQRQQLQDWGFCWENTAMMSCEMQEGTFNRATNICTFDDSWWRSRCEDMLGGVWINNNCLVPQQ